MGRCVEQPWCGGCRRWAKCPAPAAFLLRRRGQGQRLHVDVIDPGSHVIVRKGADFASAGTKNFNKIRRTTRRLCKAIRLQKLRSRRALRNDVRARRQVRLRGTPETVAPVRFDTGPRDVVVPLRLIRIWLRIGRRRTATVSASAVCDAYRRASLITRQRLNRTVSRRPRQRFAWRCAVHGALVTGAGAERSTGAGAGAERQPAQARNVRPPPGPADSIAATGAVTGVIRRASEER